MPPSLHFDAPEPADRLRATPVLREHDAAAVAGADAARRAAPASARSASAAPTPTSCSRRRRARAGRRAARGRAVLSLSARSAGGARPRRRAPRRSPRGPPETCARRRGLHAAGRAPAPSSTAAPCVLPRRGRARWRPCGARRRGVSVSGLVPQGQHDVLFVFDDAPGWDAAAWLAALREVPTLAAALHTCLGDLPPAAAAPLRTLAERPPDQRPSCWRRRSHRSCGAWPTTRERCSGLPAASFPSASAAAATAPTWRTRSPGSPASPRCAAGLPPRGAWPSRGRRAATCPRGLGASGGRGPRRRGLTRPRSGGRASVIFAGWSAAAPDLALTGADARVRVVHPAQAPASTPPAARAADTLARAWRRRRD